jgi:hypothetical protein
MESVKDLRRSAVLGLILAGALGIAGCATTPSVPEPSGSATSSIEKLCADVDVASCEFLADGVVVTVAETATDADTLKLGELLHQEASSAGLEAGAVLQRASVDVAPLDAEVSTPPRWRLTVYPGDATESARILDEILAVAAIPGSLGIAVLDGWPYVTIASLDQFEDVFDEVSAAALFAGGGTYTLLSLDERLRIVHVPERTTPGAIREIVSIARDYPAAEVLLEASTGGPQVPTLYVSRLTPEEVASLETRLSAPRLATADVDGYAVEFVLGSTGTDGTTYTTGTLGGVPAD